MCVIFCVNKKKNFNNRRKNEKIYKLIRNNKKCKKIVKINCLNVDNKKKTIASSFLLKVKLLLFDEYENGGDAYRVINCEKEFGEK